MAKSVVYPYKAVDILNFNRWVIGEERVKQILVGPGQPGTILLIIEREPCEDDPEVDCTLRYMVSPAQVVFEVGDPQEVDVPDPEERPKLLVPSMSAPERIRQ